VNGNSFNVNILKQGNEGPVMKALLKKFGPGEDRFGEVKHHRSENECVVIDDAVSCLECSVTDRMDAGDHYIVYGTVNRGILLDAEGLSAVHHRNAGNSY
jgi:flavin reductase (DIM6/NTAB) family NADH-FMN oxidoreductase RutF